MKLRHRCPWCGAEDRQKRLFGFELLSYKNNQTDGKCEICGKKYATKKTWHYFTCFSLGIISMIISINNYHQLILVILFYMIIMQVSGQNSPYIRVSTGKWYERVYPYPKPKSVKAIFDWLSVKDDGIFLINYRVQEDVILPVCFVDATNKPISQTWCVVFENIKRKGKFQMEAEIHLLLEEAPVALLETGNRFVIFGDNNKIGNGEVI